MGAFLGISLWIALATVVPGLMTIAAIYAAIVVVNPDIILSYQALTNGLNEWVVTGFAVTMMVLTQALGILLEKVLIDKQWLGPEIREVNIEKGIDPHGKTQFTLTPYFEYKGLYILLAELRENEDTQGHLKRVLAQYFLTNNSLISFLSGMLMAIILFLGNPNMDTFIDTLVFVAVLGVLFAVSFKVAVIRFEVMTKALWAARRKRLANGRL
ncbi:MAG: hypothetical protein U9R28_08545 [Pseudomonadota bacterium]|nr:hypothetical protein [Pseudomonadota bacterium]